MVLMEVGGGFQLDTPAGLAYLRARRDGCPAGITTATRSYAQQLNWYIHQGQPGYPAKADNPKRSKHVWRPNDPYDTGGRALDLPAGGPREWMRQHGKNYGWIKDRVSKEPWHFEYELWNDQSLKRDSSSTPIDTTPEVTEEEVEDMMLRRDQIEALWWIELGRKPSEWDIHRHIMQSAEDPNLDLLRLRDIIRESDEYKRWMIRRGYQDMLGYNPSQADTDAWVAAWKREGWTNYHQFFAVLATDPTVVAFAALPAAERDAKIAAARATNPQP